MLGCWMGSVSTSVPGLVIDVALGGAAEELVRADQEEPLQLGSLLDGDHIL